MSALSNYLALRLSDPWNTGRIPIQSGPYIANSFYSPYTILWKPPFFAYHLVLTQSHTYMILSSFCTLKVVKSATNFWNVHVKGRQDQICKWVFKNTVLCKKVVSKEWRMNSSEVLKSRGCPQLFNTSLDTLHGTEPPRVI